MWFVNSWQPSSPSTFDVNVDVGQVMLGPYRESFNLIIVTLFGVHHTLESSLNSMGKVPMAELLQTFVWVGARSGEGSTLVMGLLGRFGWWQLLVLVVGGFVIDLHLSTA